MTAEARAYVRVRVVPRAARTRLGRDAAGGLRAHLAAAPVEGAANRALVLLLARHLGVPQSTVELARGAHGREKVLCVHGRSQAEVDAALAAVGSDVDKAPGGG